MVLTRPVFLHALRLFAAASIALALAIALELQNPFWAAMPVWVVVQAYRQDLIVRAVFRVIGTLIGAGLALWVLYTLQSPFAQSLALGAMIGLGTFMAFRIGTIYSYGPLIAAITVGVIILPALDHPINGADLAIDRIWCTFIGVFAVTIATFPFTPKNSETLPRHIDHGLRPAILRAAFSSVAAFGAGLGLSYFGGPVTLSASLSICVFVTLLGAMPNPDLALKNIIPGAILGVSAAVIYRMVSLRLGLEGIDLFLLAIVFIAGGALLHSHPRTAALGLDANMCFLLAAEAGTTGHAPLHHITAGVALVGGAACVVLCYRLARFTSSRTSHSVL